MAPAACGPPPRCGKVLSGGASGLDACWAHGEGYRQCRVMLGATHGLALPQGVIGDITGNGQVGDGVKLGRDIATCIRQ